MIVVEQSHQLGKLLKKIRALLPQLGVVALLLSVLFFFFGCKYLEGWYFGLSALLSMGFLYLGYRAFKEVMRLSRKESSERKRRNDQMLALLASITEQDSTGGGK